MNLNFNKNLFLQIIIIILIIHSAVLILLINKHNKSVDLENKPHLALMEMLVSASKNVPEKEFNQYIDNLDESDMRINNSEINLKISNIAQNPMRLQGADSLKNLNTYLKQDQNNLRFSYLLPSNLWLNYNSNILHNFYYYLLLMALSELIIIASILFYGWAIWRFSIPIKKLQISAEKLGLNIHRKPINISGPAIVQETAHVINQMQERIQTLMANKSKMLAAISHDLRTPLTRLKLRTQFINDKIQSEKISKDLDEMELMLNNILQFVKNDYVNEKKVKFDVSELLNSICDDFTDIGQSVCFTNEKNQHVLIFGRLMSLKRAFTNLIENGIKYGDSVTVIFSESGNIITVIVKDNGPGIEESELDKVFDPYYRSPSTKRKLIVGSGLGLAITQEIIKAHGGTIILENCISGGLKVIVSLPVDLRSFAQTSM
jgi:signal transduction histidine kinase